MPLHPPTPPTRMSSAGSSSAVEEPRTAGSATAALRRLGDAAVPLVGAALARGDAPRRAPLVHAAAAAAAEHGIEIIAPALEDPDRAVVLEALDALDAAGARGIVAPEALDGVFLDAAALAARALAVRTALAGRDGPLVRALDDEVDLARRLVVAVLALRHGDRIREAVRVVDHGEGARRAIGVEALDVLLSRDEAALALPLVRRDLTPDERAAAFATHRPARAPRGGVDRGHRRRSGGRLALVVARRVRPPRGRAPGSRVVVVRAGATVAQGRDQPRSSPSSAYRRWLCVSNASSRRRRVSGAMGAYSRSKMSG